MVAISLLASTERQIDSSYIYGSQVTAVSLITDIPARLPVNALQ